MADTIDQLVNSNSLGDVIAVDFVNKFGYDIDELLQVLGVTRRMTLSQDQKVQTYKFTTTMANIAAVGEGEDIPLSTVTKAKDREFAIALNKYRKITTLEAIRKYGKDAAVNQTDKKILEEIQDSFKTKFFSYLATAPTKQSATGLQQALSLGWAKAKGFFRGNVPIISFVSPMDVATYLGDAPIVSSTPTAYGFTILTNFLNQTVAVFDSLPAGTIYTTAAENIILANANVTTSEIASTFNFTGDESGLIGMLHDVNTTNLTTQTVIVEGTQLFTEVLDGVVATTITPKV